MPALPSLRAWTLCSLMKSMFEVPHASVVLTGEQAHLWSHGGKPSWKRKGGSFCQW